MTDSKPQANFGKYTSVVAASALSGFAAFGLAAFVCAFFDFAIFGNVSWLRTTTVPIHVINGAFDAPIGMFYHVAIFWISFAGALSLSAFLAPKELIENRGLSYTFLSWMFYLIPSTIYFQACWITTGWTEDDIRHTQFFMFYPMVGSIIAAVYLLLFWKIAKARNISPWTNFPWWSIFLPTISGFAAGLIVEPIFLLNGLVVH